MFQSPRITSGTAKNKKLKTPSTEKFRAVQDVAKQALFSILGEKVVGATCLDLYAGSGNVGLEALSRGATWCAFVEQDKNTTEIIQENIRNCDFVEQAQVIRSDAVKYAANTPQKYDLIFADPFYDNITHKFLLKNLEEILNDSGLIAFFHGQDLNIDQQIEDTSLKIHTQRRFGRSYITILKK
jgi:16S rRNA (guanine966-N2)-methyltransferase